jgi:DNA (cytosine-5)-methyltransferase 1
LFEEVVFLANWAECSYVVENVIPYYEQMIPGSQKIARHLYWANFTIPEYADQREENLRSIQIPQLQEMHGIYLDRFALSNKRQVLRNCVSPAVGRHILDAYLMGEAQAAVDEAQALADQLELEWHA